MVVLAASICTRGGKGLVSRQFRPMPQSRIEQLLADFPRLLADQPGTQHTTVESDSIRYIYQPIDTVYLLLITTRNSNILQDIDSLHLFSQVVSSICKTLDERGILASAFELLSAFDELVTLGYRESLTLSQIKTFLDMESHEERIQEIIARNKELEASEERKRKAKQLEMQRKELSRSSRSGGIGSARVPSYPTYTPPVPTTNVPDTYDSYAAAQNKSSKPLATRGKGMQLGKKSKTTNMFDAVRADLGPEAAASSSAPLMSTQREAAVAREAAAAAPASARASTSTDREAIHITISETISAKLTREGTLESLDVKGDLQLRITDPSLTQVKLDLNISNTHNAQLTAHPKVDKALFRSSRIIQLADPSKGFPANNAIGVMRWKLSPTKPSEIGDPPISFTVWVNDNGGSVWNVTVEYEWSGGDPLRDVAVTIPYSSSEPSVSSHDAVYEVTGDSLEWNVGAVDEENASGSFEFEAGAESESEFFPMSVRFAKTRPFVDVDVSAVTLLSMGQEVGFSKDVQSVADKYLIV